MFHWHLFLILQGIVALGVAVLRLIAIEDSFDLKKDTSANAVTLNAQGEQLYNAVKADASEDAVMFGFFGLALVQQYDNWWLWQWNNFDVEEQEQWFVDIEAEIAEWEAEQMTKQ